MFFVKSSDRPAQGTGFYDEKEGKFILMEGSLLATEVVNSFKSIASRDLFIKEHCKIDKGQIILLHDVSFESPSGASGFVLGRPSNGWDDWKDSDGKKLSEIVKR
jgi:predicted type IV restriction endonuclease